MKATPLATADGRARARWLGAAAATLWLLALPGHAETHVLDDSLSQVFPPAAEWDWEMASARSGAARLTMNVRVNVRIDTRRWVGRSGRIYMVLPLDGGGTIVADWQTQGLLLGGRMQSGERALVYAGNIPGPMLEDTMRVRLSTDSRKTPNNARRLDFRFELDTP